MKIDKQMMTIGLNIHFKKTCVVTLLNEIERMYRVMHVDETAFKGGCYIEIDVLRSEVAAARIFVADIEEVNRVDWVSAGDVKILEITPDVAKKFLGDCFNTYFETGFKDDGLVLKMMSVMEAFNNLQNEAKALADFVQKAKDYLKKNFGTTSYGTPEGKIKVIDAMHLLISQDLGIKVHSSL